MQHPEQAIVAGTTQAGLMHKSTSWCIAAMLSAGLTVLFPTHPVWAQSAQDKPLTQFASQDFDGLLQQALQYDKTFQAAMAQHRANLEGKSQALAAFLPNLSFNAQVQKDSSERSALGRSSNSDSKPRAYSLNLRQALFQPKAWETYQQSELSGQASELALRNAKQDLIVRLAQAYFDVLAAQDTLSTLQSQKTAISEQLAAAKRNFEIGTSTVTDQQEAQARFDLAVAQELGAQNQLALARLQLQTLTGPGPVQALRTLDPQVQLLAPQPQSAEEWATRAARGNLQTLQAELNRQIAAREVSKSKYGHLPTLDLQGQVLDAQQQVFDTSTGRPFDVAQESTTLTLQLNVPIFSGGLTQSQVRQQSALLGKAQADADNARIQGSKTAQAAYLTAMTGLSQVRALDTAVRSSQLALQANRTGYEVGVRINIDVLNAQQQLASAQQSLSRAKYDTLLNLLRLQAAVGQLDETALADLRTVFAKP